jgi:dTDP-glucose 4,6-dehydratase
VRLAASGEHTPVNIGNPTEFTMLECAREVLSVTGSRSEIVHKPLPQDDPTRRRPDITKARALLNWEPKVPLREGLAKSLAYFQSCLTAESESLARS